MTEVTFQLVELGSASAETRSTWVGGAPDYFSLPEYGSENSPDPPPEEA
jgi:hypothetical protein